MAILIDNLSSQVTQMNLQELFQAYGSVKQIWLPIDWKKNKVRNFAFVEMLEKADEAAAISDLKGLNWMGHQLQISEVSFEEPTRYGQAWRSSR